MLTESWENGFLMIYAMKSKLNTINDLIVLLVYYFLFKAPRFHFESF